MKPNNEHSSSRRGPEPAFLLAQLGAHAARQFAERLSGLKLIPAHAGILRILDSSPGMTQQALAARLKMVPSRLVALLDEMESLGLTERREDPGDRRRHALHLSGKGREVLGSVSVVAREHQQALLAGLTEEERRQLGELLQKVADQQGLTRGVHPGYSRLRVGREKKKERTADDADQH